MTTPTSSRPGRPDRERIDFGLAAVAALTPPGELLAEAGTLGIEFEPGDLGQLGRFLAMLLAANRQANLTSITEPAEAWRKHILDSLTLLQVLAEIPEGGRVIDVGTGGGLPGIPLAIVLPTLRFTLLEATGKKVEFLKQAAAALGLANVEIVQGRAEGLGQDRGEKTGTGRKGGHREQYDAVVARAVGAINVLAELTVPLAKPSGVVALIKGQKAAEELEAAKEALHQLKAVHEATIETPTGRIVVLSKGAATPKMYPRRDGEPNRAPIGSKVK
ncbi:Ribosomal RNA small subunit methyltransferase G [Phycisphaerales bacterium]|nr:Ribosomal RNA small subunit methyltransferase G [Phycisphaerales bacterium]